MGRTPSSAAIRRRDSPPTPCRGPAAAERKRLVPGGHLRLRFTDPGQLARPARVLAAGTSDDDELTRRVPGDGGVESLRILLTGTPLGHQAWLTVGRRVSIIAAGFLGARKPMNRAGHR
ncbi:hypothetical protein [Actinoplanes subtropicus]|uniref:hypothetical protein n=1 Tax=Actinoplanes subtropicus TaxID=543632 RepID=UPI0004C3F281|nr:hypothetical protein [Actinoplanes subtropicus]